MGKRIKPYPAHYIKLASVLLLPPFAFAGIWLHSTVSPLREKRIPN
jgi:hypothetical protein